MGHEPNKRKDAGGALGKGKYVPKHMRVKKVITLCSVVVTAVLAIAFAVYGGNAGAARADEQSSNGTTTIESVTMRWADVPNGTDPKGTYTQAPGHPGEVSYKATFDYALSGSEDHAPGTVTIRIPAHIFRDRDGSNWADTISLSVPEASSYTGNTDYDYTYDSSNDEIVITNTKTISASSKALFDITYKISDQTRVVDMAQSRALSANMSIKDSKGGTVSKTSNAINGVLNTFAQLRELHKKAIQGLDQYPSSGWGDVPADANDYVYVIWNLQVMHEDNTQPSTITVTDQPATDGLEVVGYRTTKRDDYGTLDSAPEGEYSSGDSITIDDSAKSQSDGYYIVSVLTRYPKSKLVDGKATLKNVANASAQGVDGKDEPSTVQDDADYTFEANKSFSVPNVETGGKKGSDAYSDGGIDALKEGRNATFSGRFQNYADVQGYKYTLVAGGDSTKAEDYGQKSYKVELVDDTFSLTTEEYPDGVEGERLVSDDYEIPEVRLSTRFYDYVLPSGETTYKEQENKSGDWHPVATLWGKFSNSDEWVKLGDYTWRYDDNQGKYEYKFTDANGTVIDRYEYDDSYYMTYQPKRGCIAVKLTCNSNYYRTQMELDVNPTLLPSDHVKGILGEAKSAWLIDKNAISAWDSDGNQIGKTESYRADAYITALQKQSFAEKELIKSHNDPNNSRVELTYRAMYGENIDASNYFTDGASSEEKLNTLMSSGLFRPQSSATFYDLLPQGVEPDLSSVVVKDSLKGLNAPIYVLDYYIDSQASVACEVHSDWRGSGRTLLVVHVAPSDPNKNYCQTGSGFSSLICIEYKVYYSWEDYSDFGQYIENDVAIQTGNVDITGGRPDDAGVWANDNFGNYGSWTSEIYSDTQALLSNLTGSTGTKANQFLYARSLNYVTAEVHTSMDLDKSVKGPGNQEWTSGRDGSVIVSAGDEYQYRLRMGSQPGSSTTGIVLYDSLENYSLNDGGATWRGTFKSVDTQQLVKRGIAPVVYYSTVRNLDLSVAENRVLTNGSVWTSTAPDDLSKVTAIAIDCRTGSDGNPFSLGPGETIAAFVNMTAPTGDAYRAAYNDSAYAYNQVYAVDVLHNIANGKTDDQAIHQEYTQVGLRPVPHYMPTTGSTGRSMLQLAGVGMLAAVSLGLLHAWRRASRNQ